MPATKRDVTVPLSFKEVAEILKLIDASECDEVVLELEGTRLVVRRNSGSGSPSAAAPAAAAGSSQTSAPSVEAPARVTEPAPETPTDPGLLEVRSPMVGTFYRKPSPEDPPFVEEGAKVKKGDTLCLVEVMKLFTTVEAPEDGTIAEIAQEDGATIEFNQLLFRMRT